MRLNATDGWSGWSLRQLDLNAMLPLLPGLYLQGHFARRSWDWDLASPDTIRPQNERKGGGILVSAGRFSEGPGDLGLCRELCSVDSDCQRANEGFICRPMTPALVEYTGRPGACALPPPPDPDPAPAAPAPDAG